MSKPAIVLSRKQIDQLKEIIDHFEDIDRFELFEDHSTGIGPVIKVHFTIFNKNDSSVDITDVTNW